MQILECWKKSISFFNQKSLKLFSLIAAKTIKTVYAQIFSDKGLLPLALLLVSILLKMPYAVEWLFSIIFLFFIYLSIRSSVGRKTYSYYFYYWRHMLLVVPLLIAIFFVLSYIGYWWWGAVNIVIGFGILFYCDNRAGLSNFFWSFVRAIRMFVYNLPVALAVMITINLMWGLYMSLISILAHLVPISTDHIAIIFLPVFLPIECTLISNLYITWLHQHYELYFIQAKSLEQ